MSKDIEAAKFILKQPSKNGPIVEEVCENLGSNHLPYSWIETYCDEIMDDYAGKIYMANSFDICLILCNYFYVVR